MLVVDDDELERALIADHLAQRGFAILQAEDGRAALEILRNQTIQVLLTDLSMPHMDGLELTREVRALGLHDMYIIMLTAHDGETDFERGYDVGVDDYLSKKIRQVELLARVHNGFSTVALRRELREARASLQPTR
jgi:sigma-B regulation protein RsbU (phosphoserine phosphatase)